MTPSPRVSPWAAATLLACAYFLAGKFGLSLAFVHRSATAVWPPTGMSLAVLLLFGIRLWPGIFLGAFLVNLTTEGTVATSLGIAAGNTLEAVLGTWLINRFAAGRRVFDRARSTIKFVLLVGFLSTVVSATFGVTSLLWGGFATRENYGPIWLTWWLGDTVRAIILAPFLVMWTTKPFSRVDTRKIMEAVSLALVLMAVGWAVFGRINPRRPDNYPLIYLTVLPLLWAAFRFGGRGAVTSALTMSVISIWGTLRGYGPFVVDDPNTALLFLQTFMATNAVTALIVAALVSERQRSEAELARKAQELARSNEDLQQFAMVSSHDLKEPLRKIGNYATLLATEYQGKLNNQADQYLSIIIRSVIRLQESIDDLLAYSRAGSEADHLEALQLEDVLNQTLSDLDKTVEQSGARVTHGPLPEVMGSPAQIQQLLQNLITNGIKFKGAASPEVHISAEERAREWVVSVRDNGIGIDPKYAERIFRIFHRLHGQEEYPGSGIGLAICKKIIERHGGRIWVESKLGSGATFRFSLPKRRGSNHGNG